LKRAFVSALAVVFLSSILIPAQTQETQKLVGPIQLLGLYDPILSILFPIPSDPPPGYLLVAIFRFMPASKAESQINIIRANDGQFVVTEYYLPPGSRSIDARLAELYDDPNLDTHDPAKLATRFKVESRTVSVPTKILDDLFGQLDHLQFPSMKITPGRIMVTSNGPSHMLWYRTTLGEVRFSSSGSTFAQDHGRPIDEWMDRVKQAVDSAK
jgi:hypothetical protein